MGAIAVFLSALHDDPSVVATRMIDAAPHRGTEVQTLVLGRCAMAARTGNHAEPDAWVGVHDGLAVAFTGSLDNAVDLARDLWPDGSGHAAAGGSIDIAKLLAAAFHRFGAELPARMRGVFAAGISDGHSVLCFRDHIGYRPLFFREDASGFMAASEAKQVVAGASLPRQPDLDVVERIFYRDVDDEMPASLVGVRRLPKSTAVRSEEGATTLSRYWQPEALLESATYRQAEIAEHFTRLMDQAVSRVLTGRDAISLSGGIDSPAIAAFAAPRHRAMAGRELQAISAVYPRYPSVDESRYVEILARAFSIPLHTYELSANALDDIERWVGLADTPWPGAALAQYEESYVHARNLGARRVLTGEHAEFVAAMQWYTLEHYLLRGRWSPARRELAERRTRGWTWWALTRLVIRSLVPYRVMAARNSIGARTRPAVVPDWIDRRRAADTDVPRVRDRWRRSQLVGFIGPGISLEAEEVCQDVSGVVSRKPWTDVDLWEFFLSIPAEQKFPDLRPKGLVRDLLRGRVPDEILDRRDKTVFDEAHMAEVDYAALRRLLGAPKHRLGGVDYGRLATLLESERFTTLDYRWARNLAVAQAFLAQW